MRAHRLHLPFRRDSHELQEVPQRGRRVQGLVGVEEADLLRIAPPQLFHPLVILVPVTPNAFLAVRRVILGEGACAEGIVVPAGRRPGGPMVRRQGKALVQPLAEADDDFFAGSPQADDAEVRLGGQGRVEVGQIKGSHVAKNAAMAVLTESGKPLTDDPFRIGGLPGQKRRLFVGRLRFGLLVEDFGQRSQSAAARTYAQDYRLVHYSALSRLYFARTGVYALSLPTYRPISDSL